jgi:hexosaminidase
MKKKYQWILGACAALPLWANANLSQSALDTFAKNTTLTFAVEDNFFGEAGQFIGSVTLTNQSNIALPKGKSDWQIYIHSVRKIAKVAHPGLKLEHVNGDLHRLVATEQFPGLKKGETLKVEFEGAAWVAAYTDFMPRAFITTTSLTPAIFANTDTEDMTQFVAPFERENQLKRYNKPTDHTKTPNAALRFEQNLAVNSIEIKDADKRIIPMPEKVEYKRGNTILDASWQIRFAGRLKSEVAVFAEDLADYGLKLDAQPDHVAVDKGQKVIELQVSNKLTEKESYSLSIEADKIRIVGADNAGVFYGIQSLLALFPAGAKDSVTLTRLEIKDAPRFNWRGMHYDNGRNFHGKDAMFKLVDQMARYKLNKFHWHFSEDEGWRLEIPGLPELTDIGGTRCFDLAERECLLTQLGTGPFKSGSGNGYLTRAEFVELLKYAKARHIDIIPEIEGPGHARAAIKAMEARYHKLMKAGDKQGATTYLLSDLNDKSKYMTVQNYTDNSLNVCMDSTYTFIEKVTYELQGMYRDAGTRLVNLHFGGDEVGKGAWEGSPECHKLFAKANNGVAGVQDLKPYFTQRVAEIFARRGIAPGAWEDGLMYDATTPFKRDEFPNQVFTANVWDNIWEWGVADRAYRLANEGYQVILSHGTHLYFDHPYEAHPMERGYYWAARFTDTQKVFSYMPDDVYANADFTRELEPIVNLEALVGRELPALEKPENILGIQGQVWSETIRTEEQVMQMMFPRLLPLAERAWHKASWEGKRIDEKRFTSDWAQFAATLSEKELAKLVAKGISVRLPVPGAIYEDGKLLANSAFPMLTIQYSIDNGATWTNYAGPTSLKADAKVLLRTYLDDKNVSRITELSK